MRSSGAARLEVSIAEELGSGCSQPPACRVCVSLRCEWRASLPFQDQTDALLRSARALRASLQADSTGTAERLEAADVKLKEISHSFEEKLEAEIAERQRQVVSMKMDVEALLR